MGVFLTQWNRVRIKGNIYLFNAPNLIKLNITYYYKMTLSTDEWCQLDMIIGVIQDKNNKLKDELDKYRKESEYHKQLLSKLSK